MLTRAFQLEFLLDSHYKLETLMAESVREDDPAMASLATPSWSPFEILLLASACDRHGTDSWPAVAAELTSRANFLSIRPAEAYTPKVKYANHIQ